MCGFEGLIWQYVIMLDIHERVEDPISEAKFEIFFTRLNHVAISLLF